MIILVNCKSKLEALGINMEAIGSGEILSNSLINKLPFVTWDYSFMDDKMTIYVEDAVFIPDLSEFGEVVINDKIDG